MKSTTTTTAFGVLGTGSYLPPRVVGNAEVGELAGVEAEWIEQRTGIRSRRRAAAEQATSDLAVLAGRLALGNAGIEAEQLSWIIVATSTPDHPQPATASLVQDGLGARRAGAFDMNAVCSGFALALTAANGLLSVLAPGAPRYALVIGADVYSRILDWRDRKTAILFGDGAGAVVLGPVPHGRGIVGSVQASDGHERSLIGVAAGGSREPASAQTVDQERHFFRMDGRGVKEYVRKRVPQLVSDLLNSSDVEGHEVGHFFPHQANGAMLVELLPLLGMPNATTHLTVSEYGNTSAASIPITLDEANRRGELADGDLVALAGFGGGMSMGGSLIRWHRQQ